MATAKKPAPRAPAKKNTTRKPATKPAATKTPVRGKAATDKVPAKAPAKPAPVVKTAAVPKADKPKKPKLVRDSFTIPKAEYVVLEELKQRAAKLGQPAKKSEVLRAGVKALAAMADEAFGAALRAVPAVKTGRPAKAD
ncbi:hypothetical protein FN976_08325 [Caenimonas sedimenti]|uniref:Uncharacterized protein n=1 Tax=Caenimonas sedimenti TaxID=2596921 RepID=A0A562ZTP5_9BURK|nr:hypothetical protein [Caenimonas sedimenti]TWO71980.1 hypothetical protein FN976_08325 [Caenimonas sedimenti]